MVGLVALLTADVGVVGLAYWQQENELGHASAIVSSVLGGVIVGAGVAGLAIAAATARGGRGPQFIAMTVLPTAILVGAVAGGFLGGMLTTTPGVSRPITAAVGMAVVTTVMVPLVWRF